MESPEPQVHCPACKRLVELAAGRCTHCGAVQPMRRPPPQLNVTPPPEPPPNWPDVVRHLFFLGLPFAPAVILVALLLAGLLSRGE